MFLGASVVMAIVKLYMFVLQIFLPWSLPVHSWIGNSGFSSTSVWMLELVGCISFLVLIFLINSSHQRNQKIFVILSAFLSIVLVFSSVLHVGSREGEAEILDFFFGFWSVFWLAGLQTCIGAGVFYSHHSSSNIETQINSLHNLTYRYKKL